MDMEDESTESTGIIEETDTGNETPATDENEDSSSSKNGVQNRINEITRKRRDAERQAEYWKGVAEGRKESITKKTEDTPKPKELDPNDFDSDAEFIKAVAKQTREETLREIREEKEREEQQRKNQTTSKILKESRTKYDDFDQVALNTSVPVTEAMFDAAYGDNLGEVLYFLGSNPDEASRISQLSPLQQAKEIGRIETKITSTPTPKKKETKAPTPPSTLDGGAKNPPKKKDSEKSRAELHREWEAKRRRDAGLE